MSENHVIAPLRGACAAMMLALSTMLGTTGCASTTPTMHEFVADAHAAETPPPSELSDPRDIRVMSFNLRCPTIVDGFDYWPLRKEKVVRTIRSFDPDVLGTQECVAEQADYLCGQLPEYNFVGAGRNDGKRGGEMCGIFFKRDRFVQIDSGSFWLSQAPDKPGSKSWASVFARMVTWVKLRRVETGQTFCLFNTHFDAFSKRARIAGAGLLKQKIDAIAMGMPVVVTGDFNDVPGSETYHRMSDSLVDSFRFANPQVAKGEGTMHWFNGRTHGPRIDWILTSSTIQPMAASINHHEEDGRYPSDHFPIQATLRFNPANPMAKTE